MKCLQRARHQGSSWGHKSNMDSEEDKQGWLNYSILSIYNYQLRIYSEEKGLYSMSISDDRKQ